MNINSIGRKLTLSNLGLSQWRNSSLLYRLSGSIRQWRQGSWLMQWGEVLGVLLVALVLGLSPFVGTALIGVLLIACGGFWLLLTLSDDPSQTAFTPIHLQVLIYWGVGMVANGDKQPSHYYAYS
ncbi:MAG: hypothetical protein WBA77_03640 [Microcoleaceae cyanobacterium]